MTESEKGKLIVSRRNMMKTGSALVAGGMASGLLSPAMAQKPKVGSGVSAASIPVGKNFPAEMWKQKPWTFDAKAPFDFNDPLGRWAALLKSTQNLIGKRTYVSSYSRIYLTEVGKQSQIFYGSTGSWTFQNVVPLPGQFPQFGTLPKGTALQLGLYTGVQLDPYTFKPVEEVYNPIIDRKVRVEDTLFAESYLLYPGGGMTSVERSQFMNNRDPVKHSYIRSGKELAWCVPALFAGEGDFQPRMDSSWWVCDYDKLQDPTVNLIDCKYSWVGLTRAAEKPWWGMQDMDDGTYGTLWNTYGTVTNTLEKVEGSVLEYVFSKYPERA